VLPKHKLIQHLYDVFFVLRVFLVQHLNQLGFNKPLFVQPFFILKHFQSYKFLLLVVENSEHNAKRTLTQLFNDFVSIVNMVVVATMVLLLIRVESVVGGFIQTAPLSAAWQLSVLASPPLPLLHVEKVNGLVIMNFPPFNFCQVVAKTFNRFSNCHWKFMLADMCNGRRGISIRHLHTHRRRYVDFHNLAACPDWSWGLQGGTSGA
jgi:hypothetical protein